jgi:hypothetical protein
MAKIEIRITERGKTYRKGNLFIDGRLILRTLEDTDRMLYDTDDLSTIETIKQKHFTAIPYGTYNLELKYSPKFKKMMPYVLDVKGFDNIMIRQGNSSEESSGCILVGCVDKVGEDWISFSLTGMRILMSYICNSIDRIHTLTITPN